MQGHKTSENPLLSDDPTLLIEQSLGDIVELLQQNGLLCAGNYQDLPDKLAEKGHFLPCYDSRLLGERHLFVAIAGEYFDGHKFISAALEKGSKAVICEVLPEQKLLEQLQQQGILVLQVKQSRQALSLLSAACFGTLNTFGAKQEPRQKPKQAQLQVLGVTGTDGKSSIAYLLYQILRRRHKVGLLSTFGLDLGNGLEANPVHQTTPESLLVHCALAQMRAQGCRYAVLECSSHGLSQKTARLQHVEFAAAIFSNLSPEHLEFHGSMEAYARDKAALFARLRPRGLGKPGKPGGIAVWNMDESSSEALYAAAQMPEGICHIGYGTQLAERGQGPKQEQGQEQKLDLPRKKIPFSQKFLAHKLKLQIDGSEFEIQKNRTQENKTKAALPSTEQENSHCKIAIPGSVYVSNTLAALALSCALEGETLQNMLDSLKEGDADLAGAQGAQGAHLCLRAPKGRMQLLSSSAPFSVLVDYAHSPGAFARLLPEMRALLNSSKSSSKDVNKPNKGRLLLLFGSGGQRDRTKRPLQGQIAAEHADVIVLCNEDPRNEDPMAILQEIRAGIFARSDLGADAFTFCEDKNLFAFYEGKNLFLLPDRKAAIHKILAQAQAGDLVLLLGKGHETSIIVEGLQELPWDEFEVAKEALEAMAYHTY